MKALKTSIYMIVSLILVAFINIDRENFPELEAVKYMMRFHNSNYQTIQPNYADEEFNSLDEKIDAEKFKELLVQTGSTSSSQYENKGVHFVLSKPVYKNGVYKLNIASYYPTGNQAEPFKVDKRFLYLNKADDDYPIGLSFYGIVRPTFASNSHLNS
jgi:hypothetical protein